MKASGAQVAARFNDGSPLLTVKRDGEGVAALLTGVVRPRGRVGVIISGGNVDGPTMASILGQA